MHPVRAGHPLIFFPLMNGLPEIGNSLLIKFTICKRKPPLIIIPPPAPKRPPHHAVLPAVSYINGLGMRAPAPVERKSSCNQNEDQNVSPCVFHCAIRTIHRREHGTRSLKPRRKNYSWNPRTNLRTPFFSTLTTLTLKLIRSPILQPDSFR